MLNLLTGCFLLSLLHAVIPNHWAPVLAVARAERWTLKRAVSVTVVAGMAHVVSTILFGLVLGLLGWRLSAHFSQFAETVAPTLLIIIGLMYAFSGIGHTHSDYKTDNPQPRKKLIFGLAATMFFAPCLEIQTFFLAAGAHGTTTLALVMLTYLFVSVSAMCILVALAYSGIQHLNLIGFAHYERRITEAVLVLIGISGFFMEW